jgi:hypothetical protein
MIALGCGIFGTQQSQAFAQLPLPERLPAPNQSPLVSPAQVPTLTAPQPTVPPTIGTANQFGQIGRAGDQRQAVPVDLLQQNQPVIVKAEAYAGRPYGLGCISYRLRGGDELIDRTEAVLLSDRENRTFYPVITRTAFRTFLENIAGMRGNPDDVHQVWFLFQGDLPLDIALSGTATAQIQVPVEVAKPRQYDRFVRQWWQAFTSATAEQMEAGDYPPIVETYLTAMIGQRLGLEVPQTVTRNADPLMQTFELLFNAESIRLETIQNSMLHGIDPSPATLPVPAPIAWTPLVVSDLPAEIDIEAIAMCVPEECFYLRFGTWDNQIWLQRLMEEYGGDLGRMVQLRGYKNKIQSKFLKQLAIQSTEWDQLFGGNLIDDVAVIGSDTYFEDGSAVGVLLHAKNSDMLSRNLKAKREKFALTNAKQNVTIKPITVAGGQIELLSSPDNRYRSFYAVSGNCHLMTTSLTLAKRFLEAGAGVRSLGQSDEFRFARYNMPLSRDDTVFVYMSSRFLQELLAPEYQIELRRRNRIITEIMMLEMAKLVAANEGQPIVEVPELVQNGYLPRGFGFRPDGGSFQPLDETWLDSIRGQRGYFLPIPDLKLSGVTQEEGDWYRARAAFFTESIRSLDPMFLAIKRYDFQNNIERVVFDGRLAPFGEEKYGWLMSMLGPPLKHEIARNPNDIIRLQASMQGGRQNPNMPPHQIFAAVQDQLDPNVDLRPTSVLRVLDMLRETPGYIGAWPNPGYLNWMPALGGPPDQWGYTYSRLLKLWRLQWQGFSVISFDQQRLERLKAHLRVVESERPAQIRLEVGDVVNSGLSNWANAVNYRRSWQTSVANVRFLNLLTQQFRVPPELARETAERMLDVELVCSLRGEYQLTQLPSGRQLWVSSAWPSFAQPVLPKEHAAPLLLWFRGLELEVTKAETQFSTHGFLDIERQELGPKLPSFDMFGGFGNLFGGGGGGGAKENKIEE